MIPAARIQAEAPTGHYSAAVDYVVADANGGGGVRYSSLAAVVVGSLEPARSSGR